VRDPSQLTIGGEKVCGISILYPHPSPIEKEEGSPEKQGGFGSGEESRCPSTEVVGGDINPPASPRKGRRGGGWSEARQEKRFWWWEVVCIFFSEKGERVGNFVRLNRSSSTREGGIPSHDTPEKQKPSP